MQRDFEQTLNSPGQRWSTFLHKTKARFRRRHSDTVALLGKYIPAGGTILDVGANFGYFAKEFARLQNGSCRVFCFEPVIYNYNILEYVTKRIDNVRIEKCALSNAEGEIEITIPVKKTGKIGPALAHFGPEKDRDYISQRARTVKMDDYLRTAGIEHVDFIKVDVEGAEILVFEGAEETLAKHKPSIFCEINNDYTQRIGRKAQEVFDFLQSRGYSAFLVHKQNKILQIAESYEYPGDYIFVHSEGK